MKIFYFSLLFSIERMFKRSKFGFGNDILRKSFNTFNDGIGAKFLPMFARKLFSQDMPYG